MWRPQSSSALVVQRWASTKLSDKSSSSAVEGDTTSKVEPTLTKTDILTSSSDEPRLMPQAIFQAAEYGERTGEGTATVACEKSGVEDDVENSEVSWAPVSNPVSTHSPFLMHRWAAPKILNGYSNGKSAGANDLPRRDAETPQKLEVPNKALVAEIANPENEKETHRIELIQQDSIEDTNSEVRDGEASVAKISGEPKRQFLGTPLSGHPPFLLQRWLSVGQFNGVGVDSAQGGMSVDSGQDRMDVSSKDTPNALAHFADGQVSVEEDSARDDGVTSSASTMERAEGESERNNESPHEHNKINLHSLMVEMQQIVAELSQNAAVPTQIAEDEEVVTKSNGMVAAHNINHLPLPEGGLPLQLANDSSGASAGASEVADQHRIRGIPRVAEPAFDVQRLACSTVVPNGSSIRSNNVSSGSCVPREPEECPPAIESSSNSGTSNNCTNKQVPEQTPDVKVLGAERQATANQEHDVKRDSDNGIRVCPKLHLEKLQEQHNEPSGRAQSTLKGHAQSSFRERSAGDTSWKTICMPLATYTPTEGQLSVKESFAADNIVDCQEDITDAPMTSRMILREGVPPLVLACERDDIETVAMLLSRRADPNATDSEGFTPLHLACRSPMKTSGRDYGDLDQRSGLVRLLLSHSANVNVRSGVGLLTPLHLCVLTGSQGLASQLIASSADANLKDASGTSSLTWAQYYRWDQFLEKDFDKKGVFGLLAAAQRGDGQAVLSLIEQHADLEEHDERGMTPLLVACERADAAVACALLDAGCNPHANDVDGFTALHLACSRGDCCLPIVRHLLRHPEIDINGQASEALLTPLHLCTIAKARAIPSLLLESGVDVHVVNATGESPLSLACRLGSMELAAEMSKQAAVVAEQLKLRASRMAEMEASLAQLQLNKEFSISSPRTAFFEIEEEFGREWGVDLQANLSNGNAVEAFDNEWGFDEQGNLSDRNALRGHVTGLASNFNGKPFSPSELRHTSVLESTPRNF